MSMAMLPSMEGMYEPEEMESPSRASLRSAGIMVGAAAATTGSSTKLLI